MLCGFEPFQHPELVGIVQTLASSQVKRIAMRTDAAALANSQDAQGAVDFGVRVFEVPFLPKEMDALSQAVAPLEASFAGIAGIRSAAATLGVTTFICADISVCKHTAPYFMSTVQAAVVAGVDAIKISASQGVEAGKIATMLGGISGDNGSVGDAQTSMLDKAHSMATQSSIAFFGDGCEHFLQGAVLYEKKSETKTISGEKEAANNVWSDI